MTLKDVQRLLQSQPDYNGYSSQQSEMFDKLRGKSFYYWDHNNRNGVSKSNSRKNKNIPNSQEPKKGLISMVGIISESI